jgi:phospholipase/carboxylesterase
MLRGAREAAPLLNTYLDAKMQQHGVAATQVALLGFSQGTMMSLHVAPRRPQAFAGVVGFSGALVAPQLLKTEAMVKPPVCLIHGTADPVVPFAAMEAAATALTTAGFSVETHARPMLPHGIDPDGIAFAQKFLLLVLS